MIKITHKLKSDKGIVYVLRVDLDTGPVVKIGYTSRDKVEERVSEILVSFWKRLRYFPRLYVARYQKVDNPLSVEKRLHEYFVDCKCEMEEWVSGYTEFFKVDVEVVKEVYDRLVNGELDEDKLPVQD